MCEPEPQIRATSEPAPGGPDPSDRSGQVGDIYQAGTENQDQVERGERLTPRPSIWVGSWLDYNNGILYGEWIDADREEAELWRDIQAMLARSPTAAATGDTAEDWGIFDYDNFGQLRIGEKESLSWVGAVGRGISEHGLAFAAWADVVEEQDRLDGFTDAFLGHYESVQGYADQLVDDLGYDDLLDRAVPDSLRPYVRFDTAQLARDMQLGGDIYVVAANDGDVWIFDARQ